MARRTVYLPESIDALIREVAKEQGESYSAAVSRLIEEGARTLRRGRQPSYVAAGEGPEDLGRMAERYLRDLTQSS